MVVSLLRVDKQGWRNTRETKLEFPVLKAEVTMMQWIQARPEMSEKYNMSDRMSLPGSTEEEEEEEARQSKTRTGITSKCIQK